MSVSELYSSLPKPYCNPKVNTITFPTAGGTASNLNYFEEFTLSMVFSGIWAANQTRNVRFSRIGHQVTVSFPAILQTANTGAAITTATTVPSRLSPTGATDTNTSTFTFPAVDNGTLSTSTMSITSAGVVTFSKTYAGSGSSGFNNFSIQYLADPSS